jgi:hypothetical protein
MTETTLANLLPCAQTLQEFEAAITRRHDNDGEQSPIDEPRYDALYDNAVLAEDTFVHLLRKTQRATLYFPDPEAGVVREATLRVNPTNCHIAFVSASAGINLIGDNAHPLAIIALLIDEQATFSAGKAGSRLFLAAAQTQ